MNVCTPFHVLEVESNGTVLPDVPMFVVAAVPSPKAVRAAATVVAPVPPLVKGNAVDRDSDDKAAVPPVIATALAFCVARLPNPRLVRDIAMFARSERFDVILSCASFVTLDKPRSPLSRMILLLNGLPLTVVVFVHNSH